MITYNKQEDLAKFLTYATTLTPEEFLGLSKVLNVKSSIVDKETGKFTMRDAAEILDDCIAAFTKLPHKGRKLILKAMKK